MRRGFTLVEVLLSLAIGAVICATAFVAVRVTGQSIAAATRLSLENRLMRCGVRAALDELDSWRSYDDPAGADAARDRPLRGDQQPFAALAGPLAQGEDFNFGYAPLYDACPDYETWWRRESRTWFRSDPHDVIDGPYDFRLGDYSLFGTIAWTDATALGGAEKRWRHQLNQRLADHLGYFALIDYAPASFMYQCYDADGAVPSEFENQTDGGIGSLYTNAWGEARARDFVSLTAGNYFTIAIPTRAPPPYDAPDINRAAFVGWEAGGGTAAPGWSVDDAYQWCGSRLATMPLKPASWPELTVTVRHYASNARQVHAATVIARSPLSAQVIKCYLSFTGTTLRGARRARGLDGTDAP